MHARKPAMGATKKLMARVRMKALIILSDGLNILLHFVYSNIIVISLYIMTHQYTGSWILFLLYMYVRIYMYI